MKKVTIMFLISFLFVSMLLQGSNVDKFEQEKSSHQLGRAPQSSNYTTVTKEFTLNPNQDNLRYDFDVYTGNTTGFTYNAVDLTNGALTPTGAIITTPFPMAEEYDGNTIYRVYSDLTFVEVNPDDGTTTALGTISGLAGTATGLAYNWGTSTMYVVILDAGNAPHLATLDLTTLAATEIGAGTGMIIAMDFADDGYLYGPAIDDDNLYQIDPATGASTLIGPIGYDLNYGQDVTYDYLTHQLYTISCGGAYILGTYDLTTGALTQIADMGGNQHGVLVTTIAASAPEAPAAPSDVTAIPDAGGALSCDISWVNPDLTFSGNPLTELLEMRVYRDEDLIYTDSAPLIGEPGNYSDAPTESGLYNYAVKAYNSDGEGPGTSVVTWVGEDVPNVVTDLLLEQTNPGVLSGTLTWVNPTTGLNGGAFNNAVLGYHIERNDGEMFEVTGEVTEYIDNTILIAGSYCYTVQAYNSIGDGGIEESNFALIADAGLLLMEPFEGGVIPTDWTMTTLSSVGWFVTMDGSSSFWTIPAGDGYYACSNDDAANDDGSMDYLITPELDLQVVTATTLTFDSYFTGTVNQVATVESSTDGTNWTIVNTLTSSTSGAWDPIVVDLSAYDGESSVWFAFHSDDAGAWGYGWCVDNVSIMGVVPVPDPGWIEGTVVISDGAGDVEDVVVSAGGETTNPLADGTYSIELQPGTYDVTATLAGYDTEVIEDVVVETTVVTTGIDFTLVTGVGNDIIAATKLNSNYPNPFNPITHIAYSIRESGNVTLEVYNLKGQLVKSLLNEVIETGDYTITWNGTDNSNKSVSSGVYFYKMKTQNYNSTKKMILMK